jgi:hypothetical protein
MAETEIERLQRHVTSLQRIDLNRELFSVRLAVTQVLEEKRERLWELGAEVPAVLPDRTLTRDDEDALVGKFNELLAKVGKY